MKKVTKFLLLIGVLFLLGITASFAQVYVPKIPRVPAIKRAPQPSPKSVWITPEWDPYNRSYIPGFWGTPPRPGAVWLEGSWVKTPKGYTFKGGHWK